MSVRNVDFLLYCQRRLPLLNITPSTRRQTWRSACTLSTRCKPTPTIVLFQPSERSTVSPRWAMLACQVTVPWRYIESVMKCEITLLAPWPLFDDHLDLSTSGLCFCCAVQVSELTDLGYVRSTFDGLRLCGTSRSHWFISRCDSSSMASLKSQMWIPLNRKCDSQRPQTNFTICSLCTAGREGKQGLKIWLPQGLTTSNRLKRRCR